MLKKYIEFMKVDQGDGVPGSFILVRREGKR